MGAAQSVEEAMKRDKEKSKNAHFMVVEGMSKLWTHKVKTCQSSIFEVSGHKWKIIVYPSGKNGTSDHVSVYLRIKDKKSLGSNGEVQCCVRFLTYGVVYDQLFLGSMDNVRFNAKEAIHGKDNLMTRGQYLKDDRLIFVVEVNNVRSNCAAVNAVPRTLGTAERLKVEEVPPNKKRFTWKINQFSSFKGDHRCWSNEFAVGQRKWKLLMYPNGFDANSRGYMSLFLHASDEVTHGPMAKTLAVSKLRVLNQLEHNNNLEKESCANWHHYDPAQSKSTCGSHKFLPLEKLNDPSKGYLVNDKIFLGVDFLLVSTTEFL